MPLRSEDEALVEQAGRLGELGRIPRAQRPVIDRSAPRRELATERRERRERVDVPERRLDARGAEGPDDAVAQLGRRSVETQFGEVEPDPILVVDRGAVGGHMRWKDSA